MQIKMISRQKDKYLFKHFDNLERYVKLQTKITQTKKTNKQTKY